MENVRSNVEFVVVRHNSENVKYLQFHYILASQARISAIENKLKVKSMSQMSVFKKTYKVFYLPRDY